jgi:hypothetical protein
MMNDREVTKMNISSISAAALGQNVLASSDSGPLLQSLQALQNSLASGDLSTANSAVQTLQRLTQASATANGNSSSNSSQLSTDLAALGGAINTGDLSTAQSAFATIKSDLQSLSSPALTSETNAASQSEQLVAELLSTVNLNTSSASDPNSTPSVLEQVYGSPSLSVHA